MSSSHGHAARFGRKPEAVIGSNWRDATPPERLQQDDELFARSIVAPRSFGTVSALRPDGGLTLSRLIVVPVLSRTGAPLVMGVHRSIRVLWPEALTVPPLDEAGYVADLAAELALMASQSGLVRLSESLEAVAGRAGELASLPERLLTH